MNPQFGNRLLSSLVLFIDHLIQDEGVAYTNTSSLLYPISNRVQGYYVYATPFKQINNDSSVAGATTMTGVYLNNTFVTPGTSGLFGINHYEGAAYFTSPIASNVRISGNYAIKDFNVKLSNKMEEELLFQTKYTANARIQSDITGIDKNTETAPIIYVKPSFSEHEPFCIGGVFSDEARVRLVVLGDHFRVIAACDLLKALKMTRFSIIDTVPFRAQDGMYTGKAYNYDSLTPNANYEPLITEAKVINLNIQGEFANIEHRAAFVDLTISTIL